MQNACPHLVGGLSDSDAISSPLPHISVLIVSTASSLLYALICPCNACLCHAVILSKYPFSSLPFPSTDDPPSPSLLHTFSSPLLPSSLRFLASFIRSTPSTSSLPLYFVVPSSFVAASQSVCLNRLNPLAASISFSYSFTRHFQSIFKSSGSHSECLIPSSFPSFCCCL